MLPPQPLYALAPSHLQFFFVGFAVLLLAGEDPFTVAHIVVMLLRLAVAWLAGLLQALVGIITSICLHRFQPLLSMRHVSQMIVEFTIFVV